MTPTPQQVTAALEAADDAIPAGRRGMIDDTAELEQNAEHGSDRHRLRRKWRRAARLRQSDSGSHEWWRAILRRRLNNAIRARGKAENRRSACGESFGCTRDELIAWVESQWDVGMSWDNYGREEPGVMRWQIDHRKPVNAFDLSKAPEREACWHYSNLRPIWASENRELGTRNG